MNGGSQRFDCRMRTLFVFVAAGSCGAAALAQSPAEPLTASFRKAVDRVRSSVIAVRPLDPARPLLPGIIPPVGVFRPGELIPRVLRRSGEIETEVGGSGVVIDANRGCILTSDHALTGSSRAAVILADGRERLASDIRRDPASDLAILLIDPKDLNLTSVKWGDPGLLEPCEWLIAIGQPAASAPAVSAGIFSTRRKGATGTSGLDFLETDARMTSVHSGGPLVNLKGEVVGICAGVGEWRSAPGGMSYAIPADRARRIALELIEFGRVRHAFLGMQVQPAPAVARNGVFPARGVVITSVTAGTPAAQAGLRPGDAIVTVGGRAVATIAMLQAIVEAAAIGDELGFSIEREGRRIDVKVRPQAQPARGSTGADGSAPRRSDAGEEMPRVRSRLGERASPDNTPPVPRADPAPPEGPDTSSLAPIPN
jgi:serine protease Do